MTDKKKVIKKLKEALDSLDITSNLRLILIQTIEYLQEEHVSERFAFKAIPRLLEMIEPTDRAKVYIAKLADTLEIEGYTTDAKIVRESLKIMNGEKVPMATMDEELVREDLKAEIKSWLDEGLPNEEELVEHIKETACHFAKWQEKQDQETIELAEDHAMLAGMEKMKKEIMKEPNLFGYVARDENGNLHIFEVKPKRLEEEHRWWDRDYNCHIIDNDAFPDLRWKDEPICVKLIIIKED